MATKVIGPSVTAEGARGTTDVYAPSDCPVCHKGIDARILHNGYVWTVGGRGQYLMSFFSCPRTECKTGFVAVYERDRMGEYRLLYVEPETIEAPKHSRFVEKVSKDFYAIYDQAYAAEHYKLGDICGVGYRKALEFLIKDYLMSKVSDEQVREAIKAKALGKCIAEDVADNHVKQVAQRATWLGNDETHYVRRWEDKGVQDLKRLIELTVRWIEMELETEEALSQM